MRIIRHTIRASNQAQDVLCIRELGKAAWTLPQPSQGWPCWHIPGQVPLIEYAYIRDLISYPIRTFLSSLRSLARWRVGKLGRRLTSWWYGYGHRLKWAKLSPRAQDATELERLCFLIVENEFRAFIFSFWYLGLVAYLLVLFSSGCICFRVDSLNPRWFFNNSVPEQLITSIMTGWELWKLFRGQR